MHKKRFSYLTSGTNEQQESNKRNYSNETKGNAIGGNNQTTSFLNSNGQKNAEPQLQTNPIQKENTTPNSFLTYAQISGSNRSAQENDSFHSNSNNTAANKSKENDCEDLAYKNKSKNQPLKMQYSEINNNYQNKGQDFQHFRRDNNENRFMNGFMRRLSDHNQNAPNDGFKNEKAGNDRRRDAMDTEAGEVTGNQFQDQRSNRFFKGKAMNVETNKFEPGELSNNQTNVPEQRHYRNFSKNHGYNQNAQKFEPRSNSEARSNSTNRDRRPLNFNAPMFEKTPSFSVKTASESPSSGSDLQNSKDGLIIRVINAGETIESKVFRIGDDLYIPSFFSSQINAKKPLSNLVTQDLAGNIISNQELARVTINLEVKAFQQVMQEEPVPTKLPDEPAKPDLLEKIMQLEGNCTPKTQSKRPTEPPSTDASSNLLQTSTEKSENTEQGKTGKYKRPLNDMRKAPSVSSDSEEDELMFQNDLYQNEANSMSLKQKLTRMKDKPEISIDKGASNPQNKPNKLAFEVDKNPVAWIVEEEQSRKQLKVGASKNGADEGKKLAIATSKVPSNRPSNYKILGQDTMRFTRETNLLEKLENYIIKKENSDPEVKQEKEMTPEEQEADAAEKEAQRQLDEAYSFANRYFAANPTKVCNRCNRAGHYESMCPEAVKVMCLFCCKKHDTSQCTSLICFHCYNTGHRAKDCTEHSNMTCFRCNKKGHKNVECGVILPPTSHYNDEKVIREKRNSRFSGICLTCGRNGHYNCNGNISFGDTNKIDNIYGPIVNGVQEPKQEAQRNNAPVPKINGSKLHTIQECSDGNQSDDGSIDSEDEKFLKRSGEKKKNNTMRTHGYLNGVNGNHSSFNSFNYSKENTMKAGYSRPNQSKQQYKAHEFRRNNNQDWNRRRDYEQS